MCTAKAEEEGVYFCTKDIDVLHSAAPQVSEDINPDTDRSLYCATNDFNDKLFTEFRHCFLMIAKKIEENGDYCLLKTDHALFGYGSEDSGSSPPRSSNGIARAETITPGIPIACVLVLSQDDIENKLHEGKKRRMFFWWTQIMNHMDEDANNNQYETFKHNCCTVAADAIKKVGGHIERINFASFNKGYGVINKDGGFLPPLEAIFSVSSQITRSCTDRLYGFIFQVNTMVKSQACEELRRQALLDHLKEARKKRVEIKTGIKEVLLREINKLNKETKFWPGYIWGLTEITAITDEIAEAALYEIEVEGRRQTLLDYLNKRENASKNTDTDTELLIEMYQLNKETGFWPGYIWGLAKITEITDEIAKDALVAIKKGKTDL